MAKNPAFPFYASDFLTDTSGFEAVEVGIYIRLLATQWVNGGLSSDHTRLARIGGVPIDVFEKAWVMIGLKLVLCEDGLLRNPKLEAVRKQKEAFCNKQSENGKKGGRPKKNSENQPKENPTLSFGLSQSESQKKPLENEIEDEIEKELEEEILFEKSEKLFADNGAKNGKTKEKQEVVMPFDSTEFTEHWQWWRKYKQEQFGFKYKSVVTEQAALNDLTRIAQGDEQTAIAVIKQSIANGWKGFFAIKSDATGPPGNQTAKKSVFEANLEANIGAKKILRKMYENGAFDHYEQQRAELLRNYTGAGNGVEATAS